MSCGLLAGQAGRHRYLPGVSSGLGAGSGCLAAALILAAARDRSLSKFVRGCRMVQRPHQLLYGIFALPARIFHLSGLEIILSKSLNHAPFGVKVKWDGHSKCIGNLLWSLRDPARLDGVCGWNGVEEARVRPALSCPYGSIIGEKTDGLPFKSIHAR